MFARDALIKRSHQHSHLASRPSRGTPIKKLSFSVTSFGFTSYTFDVFTYISAAWDTYASERS